LAFRSFLRRFTPRFSLDLLSALIQALTLAS
jgi:hypothetical protein